MYELFNTLLCYNIKEGLSLPCSSFTTTAPADEKFSHRVPTPTTLEVLPGNKYQLLPVAFWSFSFSRICILQLYKKPLISGS